jgi:hypothetical protein
MSHFLIFLLKASICMLTFYSLYHFLLCRLTFFKYGRLYLIVSLLISIVIPLIQLDSRKIISTGNLSFLWTIEESIDSSQVLKSTTGRVIEMTTVFFGIYLTGVLFFFFKMMIGLTVVLRSSRHSFFTSGDGIRIVATTGKLKNSSFFNIIFVDTSLIGTEAYQLVIEHEMTHSKLNHTYDKLLMYLVKVVFWFNPIVYFYDRSLDNTHEYEVDELLAKNHHKSTYAEFLLTMVKKQDSPLVSPFSKKPMITRIRMLFSQRSFSYQRYYYLCAIPLFILLLMAFSVKYIPAKSEFNLIDRLFSDSTINTIDSNSILAINRYKQTKPTKIVKTASILDEGTNAITPDQPNIHKGSVSVNKPETEVEKMQLFVSRQTISSGPDEYDEIKLVFGKNKLTGTVSVGGRIAYIIGGQQYEEEEIKRFNTDFITKLHCPCVIKSVDDNDLALKKGGYVALIRIKI